MTEEINTVLSLLECTLINEEKADYLEVSYQNGFVYILIAKKEYKDIPLAERIMRISSLLKFDHEDIMEKYPVIIEVLSEEELTELFKMYKGKE